MKRFIFTIHKVKSMTGESGKDMSIFEIRALPNVILLVVNIVLWNNGGHPVPTCPKNFLQSLSPAESKFLPV